MRSENADTYWSVTLDLDVWPWSYFKAKKAYVIRCRLLYCALVPGMMSMGLILYEISSLVYFMWHLTFTYDLQLLSRSFALNSFDVFYVFECLYQKLKFVGSIEFEIWTFVWRKRKWRNHDVITYLISMKFDNKSAKGIIKRHIKFIFD